jgi:hypothetical protein
MLANQKRVQKRAGQEPAEAPGQAPAPLYRNMLQHTGGNELLRFTS